MSDQSRQPDDSGPIDPPQRRRSTDRANADPRIDKFQTWLLGTIAVVSIALGSYFYSTLVEATRAVVVEVKAARSDISAIGTRVAILEAARMSERTDEHVRAIEQRLAIVEAQVKGGKNP